MAVAEMIPLGRRMTVPHVAERLRAEIIRQRLAPGTPIHSNRKICELFGVSPMTAMRAVNRLVADGLLHRVKGSGTYVGAAASTSNTKRIGVVFSLPSTGESKEIEAAYGVLRDAVVERLRGGGAEVSYLSFGDLRMPTVAPKVLERLDAAVVSCSCVDTDTIRQFDAWGKPVVLVQLDEARDLAYHQVVPDLFHGFSEAAGLLRSAGAKRVMVLDNGSRTHRSRIDAFLRAAAAAGLSVSGIETVRLRDEIGDIGRMAGHKAGLEILGGKKVDAVFSPSDFVSFGFVDACREKGVEPGKDLLLVSYDDLEGEGLLPFGEPMLTTVANPRREIGRLAADLVRSDDLTHETNVSRILRVKTNLVRRKTA